MAAACAGHAALDHAHVMAAAGRAGRTARRIEAHDLRLRIFLQAKPLAREKADRDHVPFQHPSNIV